MLANIMCLGAKYRKYKVQAGLEGLPNYAD